jgi:hypothetical protein
MFLHWTFDCGLQGVDLIIVLCQWSHNGDIFLPSYLKTLQRFKCVKWLSNIGPVSVTLTLEVEIQLLRSAHRLIIVITFAKLLKKIQRFKSYGGDMQCRLLYIRPLSVTLGDSNPIIALCTSSYNGDQLCQVIFLKFQQLKSYGADRKCRL